MREAKRLVEEARKAAGERLQEGPRFGSPTIRDQEGARNLELLMDRPNFSCLLEVRVAQLAPQTALILTPLGQLAAGRLPELDRVL